MRMIDKLDNLNVGGLYKGMNKEQVAQLVAELEADLCEEEAKHDADMAQIKKERAQPGADNKTLDERQSVVRKWYRAREKDIKARIAALQNKWTEEQTIRPKIKGPTMPSR